MRRPPRLAMRILARALRRHAAAPSILGDLEEDFVHLIESRGLTVARLW